MKLKDMVGVVFKKDEYVNIWQEIVRNYNMELVWNGEASEIPEKYLDKECTVFPFLGQRFNFEISELFEHKSTKVIGGKKRMANHYEGIAGKVREELALDEVNEEPEEFNDYMSIVTMIIAKHILECAKDLEDIGFNLEYTEY